MNAYPLDLTVRTAGGIFWAISSSCLQGPRNAGLLRSAARTDHHMHSSQHIDLRFFVSDEFVLEDGDGKRSNWNSWMSPRLLVLLDVFRFQWGRPVRVSPHPNALGRHLGDSDSEHNVDHWGQVLGLDCFPDGMMTRTDAERAVHIARRLAFTGIGIYPHWRPAPGLHLGVRPTRDPGSPATWGAIGRPQEYVSLSAALEAMQ